MSKSGNVSTCWGSCCKNMRSLRAMRENVKHCTRQGYDKSQLLRTRQIQNIAFVSTILFSVSEHDAHFTPGHPRCFASVNSTGFLAQTRSVLIIKAVQVKQLAFLASFLSDLFESLATLSCSVLCSDSRCVTWGGNSQKEPQHILFDVNSSILYLFHCHIC